jgi:hypothetical protein
MEWESGVEPAALQSFALIHAKHNAIERERPEHRLRRTWRMSDYESAKSGFLINASPDLVFAP